MRPQSNFDLDNFGDWKTKVDEFMEGRVRTTVSEILAGAFGVSPSQKNIGQSARIAKYLAAKGWVQDDPSSKQNKTYIISGGAPERPSSEPPSRAKWSSFDLSEVGTSATLIRGVRETFDSVDDRNTARYALGILCVLRLCVQGDIYSRRELFSHGEDLPKGNRFVNEQRASKSWQRSLLEKLVEDGLVAKTEDGGREQLYTVAPPALSEMQGVLASAISGDGGKLKALLFPRYGYGQSDEVEDGAPEDESEEDMGETDALSEVASQLSLAADSLQGVLGSLQELEGQSSEALGGLRSLQTQFEESSKSTLERLKAVEGSVASMLQEMKKSEVQSLSVIRDKLIEHASRKASLYKQIATEDRREEAVIQELDDVLKRMGAGDGDA